MSVLAGIYSLRQGPDGVAPHTASQETIARSISRGPDRVETWCNQRFFLAKIDVGAFPHPALIRPEAGAADTAVAAIAGHPYLASSCEPSPSRHSHLAAICRALDRSEFDMLAACHGVFALCHYNLHDRSLLLSTDRMGMRPLYYYVGQEHLYFSTALRVLEALPEVPKRMDVQGVAERLVLGFPLGPRTQYADIRVLENGQYLRCTGGDVRCESFFAWDRIAPTTLTIEQLLDRAYETFLAAVARRSADQDVCVANLSGGLDSRCIVTALHALAKEVYTLTWAMPGRLDELLARQFAETLRLKQAIRPLPPMPSWDDQLACLRDPRWPGTTAPPRPNLIFSGDGGSVGVGHVYLTEELVTWMRTGQTKRVLDYLARGLPRRVIRSAPYMRLHDVLAEGVRTEFQRIRSYEPARDLHIFYLKNDQRRHLHLFYENIDTCRVEYLLPFCDGAFMELMASGPVDAFLLHRFYHQWLERFPAVIKSVAWQTYPGHLPCPVLATSAARTQWQSNRGEVFRGKKSWRALKHCARAVFRSDFPSPFLRRWYVLAAVLLHALRLHDCTSTLLVSAELCDICSKCAGSAVSPGCASAHSLPNRLADEPAAPR